MYIGGQKDLQALDRYTMEELGLPGVVLMENAGAAVVSDLQIDYPEKTTKFVILAGSGNNGGDGFVIARRLSDFGYHVRLCLLVERERLKGDARVHFDVYCRRGLPLFELAKSSINKLRTEIAHADVIVDAMLGTGVRGGIREPFASTIDYVNKLGIPVLAVDIPSGVNADTGEVEDKAIKATKTITFVIPKKGFFLQDGPRYIGEWKVANISVSLEAAYWLQLQLPKLITAVDVKKAIPRRSPSGHKGTFGHGLVIGGSQNYVGAPLYTAKAAFRTGLGLVTLALPQSVYQAAAIQTPESLFLPLKEENGHIASDELAAVDWNRYKAITIGPGMGRFEGGERLLQTVFTRANSKPLIIDADALYFLRTQMGLISMYKGPVILTPHPGEMALLLNTTVKEVEENRLEIAQQFASTHGVFLLLKGHRTIIATPDGGLFVNPLGNDTLGKGGSGDVLAGAILSFLVQGASPQAAMVAATFLHAKAGEERGKKISNYSVTPNDVIEELRYLMKEMEDEEV